MPLGWWLRASVTPIVVIAILGGLGWLTHAVTAPSGQRPATVSATVAGLRLEAVSRLQGGSRVVVIVALRDGSRAAIPVALPGAAACHIGSAITLDQYTNHLGRKFLRAGAHPCG